MSRGLDKDLRFPGLTGAVLLTAGASVFVAWLVTRWFDLVFVGAGVLLVGTIAMIPAVVAVLGHGRRSWRTGDSTSLKQSGLVGLFLVVVVVSGVGFSYAAFVIETQVEIRVSNESGEPITNAIAIGGGTEVALGPIAPHKTASERLQPVRDGELIVRLEQAGKQFDVNTGYVTPGWGGTRRVVVREPGVATAE